MNQNNNHLLREIQLTNKDGTVNTGYIAYNKNTLEIDYLLSFSEVLNDWVHVELNKLDERQKEKLECIIEEFDAHQKSLANIKEFSHDE